MLFQVKLTLAWLCVHVCTCVQVYLHLWLKAIRKHGHVLIKGFCVDEDLEHFQEGYGGLLRAGFDRDDMRLHLR